MPLQKLNAMYEFEITCIKRDRAGRIMSIGVVDHERGIHHNCALDIKQAIQGERGGLWRFYTTTHSGGQPVRTRVLIVRGKTMSYLRSRNDKTTGNNLRFFKDCGNCDPCL